MILQPGVLALLTAGGVSLFLLAVGSSAAWGVLCGWDPSSAGERQLRLERRIELASAVVRWALVVEAGGLAAFVFVADDLHPLLTGAMCATGVLNADPLGWPALGAKLVLAAAAGLWLALHRIDRGVETQPMTRWKAAVLVGLFPLAALDVGLTAAFFGRLDPEVITSCCGSLFSAQGGGVPADLASVPPAAALAGLFGVGALHTAVGVLACRARREPLWFLLGLTSAGLAAAGAVGIVSAVGPYVYELPTHHCPFDLLQGGYGFVGVPLYLTLGGAVYCGFLPAALAPARRISEAIPVLEGLRGRWARWSVAWSVGFLAGSAWLVARSGVRLVG